MASILKNIFIVLALLATAGLGYYLYLDQNSALQATDMALSGDIAMETADFLRKLNELKAIEIDGSIFSDERFSSLTNFSVPIEAEPIGRTNPFELN